MPDWRAEYAALAAADLEQRLPAEDLERLAVAAFLVGRDDEVIELRERAHQQYLDRGLIEQAITCGFWAGFHLTNWGRPAQAAGWDARLRRLHPDDPTGRWAAVFGIQDAVGLMLSGHPESALPLFEQALAVLAGGPDLDSFALAGLGRGRCLEMLGRSEESVAALDEVMVHVVAGRVAPQVIGLAYCSMIELCMRWFDLGRAREWTRALTGWTQAQQGMVPYRGTCQVRRAEILQLRGEWDEADLEAEQACRRLLRSRESTIGAAHYRIGELARLRGRFDAAESAYGRAAECGMEVQPGLALLRMAQGRPAAAIAGIDRMLAESPALSSRSPVLAARIEIALATGDVDGAERRVAELTGYLATGSPPFLLALSEHCTGAVLLARGDAGAALPRLRRAWSLWQEVEAPYEAARTRLLVARGCHLLGDDDAAGMELAAARSVLEGLGAVVDLAGLSLPADPGTAGPLSPRELEVLRLLATGATNRVIAERLFLSEKTVARHLSNMFAKLDVTSRSAATAYAYEHGLA